MPATAANLPDGKVLLFSGVGRFSFDALGGGKTYTSMFDPATQTATERLVAETAQEFFCTGTTNLPDGRLFITGGSDSSKTSLYTPSTQVWSVGATMNIPRGYHSDTMLPDGSVFVLGGSWSGGEGGKHGEIWTEAGGWRLLSNVKVEYAMGGENGGLYRADNHMHMFIAPDGRILQVGPSAQMNWITTDGNGTITSAGSRAGDQYSQSGNAVMYDVGKILKVGGSAAYEGQPSNTRAYVIDVNNGLTVRQVASMQYPRIFSSGVVLPDGKVLVVGGQTLGKIFSDDNSVLVPELWDPATETFTPMPAIAVGRNYHSVALLLPDGRVLSGGGGLCGDSCGTANHPDVQILTPYYLLNSDGTPATRPVISSAPTTAAHGTSISVQTDSNISSFVLMRMSSNTHTVNNDQRRIPLQFTLTNATTHTYSLSIPSNPGIVLPGYYMLFATNTNGVPSVSKTILVTNTGTPTLTSPGPQQSIVGTAVSLQLTATSGNGAITYSASGLPPGLSINASTGLISGTPTAGGNFTATVTATNSTAPTSTRIFWTVLSSAPPNPLIAQYVKLEGLSEIHGAQWTAIADFNLVDSSGALISRSGWVPSADSAEVVGSNNAPSQAIDASLTTYWHSQWYAAQPSQPHWWSANLGTTKTLGGFRYRPPPANDSNGTILGWRFYTSTDGSNWRLVTQGVFPADATEKVISLGSVQNQPPALGAIPNQATTVGQSALLTVSASDPNGDTLSFTASGLPPGLAINASTGTVTGTPTTAGTYSVTITVNDGKGGTASQSFTWTINSSGGGGSLTAQFVKLEAVSAISGQPWAAMSEFNLLDGGGAIIPRTGWVVSADSSETQAVDNSPARAIDGNAQTQWNSQWYTASPPMPHWWAANLGSAKTISAFKYLPPPSNDSNGTIIGWRFYTSNDGTNWTQVAQGNFAADSTEKTVTLGTVTTNQPPTLAAVANQASTVGQAVSLPMSASDPDGDTLSFSATGLPAGLSINTSTGTITGNPTSAGTFTPTVTVSDGKGGTASRSFTWTVTGSGGGGTITAQYVKLEALSEIGGHPWAAISEFNLLDGSNAVISRTGWVASADSSETQGADNSPARAIDGSASTQWNTQWYLASPPMPHWWSANLGSVKTITAFKYLPPPANDINGTIIGYRFHVSSDGVRWMQVAQGSFAANSTEKTVSLVAPAADQPPTLAAVSNQTSSVGQSVSLALSGGDADGDPLSYSAVGLPSGLAINASTGTITGSPTVQGTYSVTVTVSDGRGGTAVRSFSWTVSASASKLVSAQYVKLEALSEISGKPWAAIAEFNLLDGNGAVIPRTGWIASADSSETQGANNSPSMAIDANPSTQWNTQWYLASPPMPHWWSANLGAVKTISAFKYLPPPANDINGTIIGWRFWVSNDGVNWTQVGSGNFAADATEKTVPISAP